MQQHPEMVNTYGEAIDIIWKIQRKQHKPTESLATLPTWAHWGQCAATEFGHSDHEVASTWSLDVVMYFGHGVIVPPDSN